MPVVLQVALGGAIGASMRHLMVDGAARRLGVAFPWGTLAVNVVGSLAMGLFFAALVRRGDGTFAPFLLTGFLGGFTTFSAFSLDTFLLAERGRPWLAAAYVSGSVLLALAAFAAGFFLAAREGAA